MTEYLTFALLGLGAGALYAALAQGAVLTHRGAGVINLANGAIAMYVAYTYAGLREGRVMVPPLPNPLVLVEWVTGGAVELPHFPKFVELDEPMSAVPATLVSAGVALVLGLLVHVLVFRPLRHASPLAKTIASVGVLLTLQAVVILRFGTSSISVPASLPSGSVDLLGATVPVDRLILAGIALAVAGALTALFRFSRLGLATRAAAENERGAVLIGLSPDRLAAVNWMLSSLISGVVGVLFAPVTGLNSTDFVLFVIPALGAALFARLQSFMVAAVTGLLIGCAQSVTVLLQTQFSWIPSSGAATTVPFLVIIVAMIVRGTSLPERGTLLRIPLPVSPEPRRHLPVTAALAVVAVAGLVYAPYDLRGALMNTLIGAVVALSFVVVVGLTGQISLFQLSLAGLAAVLMTRYAGDLGIPFPISGLLAAVTAAVVGTVAGLPALRVRGVQLGVLTLSGAYVFETIALNNTSVVRISDTNDSVPAPSVFGLDLGVSSSFPFGPGGTPSPAFGIFLLVVTLGCFALVIRLRRSDLGRQMLAVRSNERAAAGLGISVTRVKLVAFGIASFLAGVAGVLSAYQFQSVDTVPFVALASATALAFAYLGGISTVSGAVLAGMLTTGGLFPHLLERYTDLGQYELLIAGIGLILTSILNPGGIDAVNRAAFGRLRTALRRRRDAPRPARPRTDTDDGPARTVTIEKATQS